MHVLLRLPLMLLELLLRGAAGALRDYFRRGEADAEPPLSPEAEAEAAKQRDPEPDHRPTASRRPSSTA